MAGMGKGPPTLGAPMPRVNRGAISCDLCVQRIWTDTPRWYVTKFVWLSIGV